VTRQSIQLPLDSYQAEPKMGVLKLIEFKAPDAVNQLLFEDKKVVAMVGRPRLEIMIMIDA
jgi:hypothetical protein